MVCDWWWWWRGEAERACAWTSASSSNLITHHHDAAPAPDGAADAVVSAALADYRDSHSPAYSSAQLLQPGNCPQGVYVAPSEQLDRWSGVIFVRKGYYQGSILPFELVFPPAYPDRAPVVHFEKGSIVHPLVDVSGVMSGRACGEGRKLILNLLSQRTIDLPCPLRFRRGPPRRTMQQRCSSLSSQSSRHTPLTSSATASSQMARRGGE